MTTQKSAAREILQSAFPGIPECEAENMVSIGEVQSHPPGVVLCKENTIEDAFYIILNGRVKVTKVINDDETRLL
ncbi:MAG: hypothetical protein KKD28_05195, partial [Chloroflexi bacterium]|nr:hypothetical protein [Chloroflexota bacterium]